MFDWKEKNFLKEYAIPFVAGSSRISGVLGSYLAARVIHTSHTGFILATAVIGVIGYTPILKARGKWGKVKDASVKDMMKFTLFAETPSILSEFLILKMYEKQVALPTAIVSCYPILILLVEKLEPKLLYRKTGKYDMNINHGISLTKDDALKYAIPLSLYACSVSCIYMHQIYKPHSSTSGLMESAIYASGVAALLVVVDYCTAKYSQKADSEVLTYLTLAYSIPIRTMFCAVEYSMSDTLSFRHDFVDYIGDMPIVALLSLMNYYHYWGLIYAFGNTDNVSSCALVTTISGNCFSMCLEEKFNLLNFTIYAYLGVIIGIVSRSGIISNNTLTYNSKFLEMILDMILCVDCDKANQQIMVEWDNNKEIYTIIFNEVDCDSRLDIEHYNEVLLAVITKILNLQFIIKNQNDEVVLVFLNRVVPNDIVQEITIKANTPCISDQLQGHLIMVSNDHIQLVDNIDEEIPILGSLA